MGRSVLHISRKGRGNPCCLNTVLKLFLSSKDQLALLLLSYHFMENHLN